MNSLENFHLPSKIEEDYHRFRLSKYRITVRKTLLLRSALLNYGILDKKRKRTNSFTSQDTSVAGPSNGGQPNASLVNRLSIPESKKARKRRRRAERQAQEDARLKNIKWNVPIPGRSAPPHMSGVPPFPSTQAGSYYTHPYDVDDNHVPSPLNWVSSMALAAENDPSEQLSSWSPQPIQVPPPSNAPLLQSNPHPPTPCPPPLPQPQAIHALPPKPPLPPAPTIGVMPDQDPNSKHGTFNISSATKEAGTDMKKRKAHAQYIPNPARTLVMEKLPKTHRHPDFINNWSRSACGFLPVHIFIDAPDGKALIEFSAAELARKAWASPKLGSIHPGLKSHQLKGKAREDLIKVWWYRVDGVGAGAGVGEIEEGEIEGDAAEKEVEALPKPETKKERKARLAREREEKRKLREAELHPQQQSQQPQQQRHQSSAPLQNQNQQYKEVMNAAQQNISSSSLPHLFIPTHPNMVGSLHGGGLAQPLNPLLQFSPASLPYQSYPYTWNPAHPVSMPNPTTTAGILKAAYEASSRQAGHIDFDDHDSIASSTGSLTAPIEAPLKGMNAMVSTAGQGDDLSDFEEDMDVDIDEKPFGAAPAPRLVQPLPSALPSVRLPLHSSLPPRPGSMVTGCPSKPPPPNQPPPPLPPSTLSSGSGSQSYSQNLPSAARVPLLPLAAPQPKVPQPFIAQELPGQAIASLSSSAPTPAQSSSSPSTASTTPIPSEPKAMKNAPTEPSYTKRALMARQKELEEKIAKSKLELAAAAATATAKSGGVSESATPTITTSQPPAATLRPSMDLGEKQAMEDRLRKLVLQSQKARGRGKVEATTTAPATFPPPQQQQNGVQQTLGSSATVSISSHSFSLEDMAVSFITQTIDTIKSQPAKASPSPVVSSAVVGTAKPPPPPTSNPNVRLELAAKQKRLEDHILESKTLMAKLSQARSKEEKDGIMKVIREKSR